jgi:hypothetical protein
MSLPGAAYGFFGASALPAWGVRLLLDQWYSCEMLSQPVG